MFRRLPEADAGEGAGKGAGRAAVVLSVDGRAVTACEGDSVAAALMAAGIPVCRTTAITGQPRGPYCMMGVCFDCLVMIDGRPNRQACMVAVRPGMEVARQEGAPAVQAEIGP